MRKIRKGLTTTFNVCDSVFFILRIFWQSFSYNRNYFSKNSSGVSCPPHTVVIRCCEHRIVSAAEGACRQIGELEFRSSPKTAGWRKLTLSSPTLSPLFLTFLSPSLLLLSLMVPKINYIFYFFLLLKASKQYIYIFISFIYLGTGRRMRIHTIQSGDGERGRERDEKRNSMPCSSWE